MRIIRYRAASGPAWGVVTEGDRVRDAAGAAFGDLAPGDRDVGSVTELELLAPAAPSKIICVGRNYREHAAEFDNAVPQEPLLFMKPPSAVIGPGAQIHYPALSERVDPEAELVLVIGREAHRVSAAAAMDYIGGYTCGNDVTARDIQKSDGQWTRGKGFETFCPIGPWIETELDPADLRVTCTVDGELRQDGRTRDLIFPIPLPDRVHQPIRAPAAGRPDHDRHARRCCADGCRQHGERRSRGDRRPDQPGGGRTGVVPGRRPGVSVGATNGEEGP